MWQCKHCNQEFNYNRTTDKANHSKHCSSNPKRQESYNKLKQLSKIRFDLKLGEIKNFDVECACCKTIFIVEEREKQFPSRKEYYCSRKCSNSIGGKAKRDKHGITQYSTIAKKYYKEQCIVCGFDEIVDVHHIDRDRENNNPKNLVFLCPNHHYVLHRKNADYVDKRIKEFILEQWGQ
jgi:hypothetical protein